MKFLVSPPLLLFSLISLINCSSLHFSIEGKSPLLGPKITPTYSSEPYIENEDVTVKLDGPLLPVFQINDQTEPNNDYTELMNDDNTELDTLLVPLKKVEAGGRISLISFIVGMNWFLNSDFLHIQIICTIMASFIYLFDLQTFIGYSVFFCKKLEYDPAHGNVCYRRYLAIPLSWITLIIFFSTLPLTSLALSTFVGLIFWIEILYILGSFHERFYGSSKDTSSNNSYVSV